MNTDDELYNQLEQTMAEATNSRREAFEESVRRGKAERDAIEAICRTSSSLPRTLFKKQATPTTKTTDRKKMNTEDELYDRLEKAMAEARNSRQEAFEESVRRGKAERDAVEAIRRAKAAERSYSELVKKLKEHSEVLQQVQSGMESLISKSDNMEKELEKELDESIPNIVTAERLRQNQAAETSLSSTTYLPQFISEFSLAEIEEATFNFHPSLKIGEGGYASVYVGLLDNTEVAIKKSHSDGSLQGPSKYIQEVKVLGKLRHPNLITLIGACREIWTLIYEYLPNGSLEDRLSCKDNSTPLSWQTRIRIAAELCSVLVFLHSSKPHGIVHGDLKPDNILLDANLVSKLSGFGICRVLSHDDNSSSTNTTVCHRTESMGTLGYIDPEFLTTGELTPESDVYSFGIILLQLLTGKPALDLKNEVQWALDNRDLKSLLDYTAGDWPYIQAQQLAHLGLRCAEANSRNRPNLVLEVWRVLELMSARSGGASSSLRLIQAPSYFICPILMDVMKDPHVTADGYTYEAEAIRGWFDSGHDTSPMTNIELEHTNLVPNLALRSAIQEWLQEQ